MHRCYLLLILSVGSLATGCTTLPTSVGEIFAVRDASVPDDFETAGKEITNRERGDFGLTPPANVPSFVVELRDAGNKSQKFKRPLTDEGTFIDGVLTQSNALKHFGRVKIELWRPRPDGHGYHKIDIPYDRKHKLVPPAYDYAIREGDRLIFMEDDSSVLDDMLGSLGH